MRGDRGRTCDVHQPARAREIWEEPPCFARATEEVVLLVTILEIRERRREPDDELLHSARSTVLEPRVDGHPE
jgi:hypothetical protein